MLYLYLIIIRQRDRNLLCLGDSIIHLIQTEHYMLTVDMVKGCQCFTSVMQQRRARSIHHFTDTCVDPWTLLGWLIPRYNGHILDDYLVWDV